MNLHPHLGRLVLNPHLHLGPNPPQETMLMMHQRWLGDGVIISTLSVQRVLLTKVVTRKIWSSMITRGCCPTGLSRYSMKLTVLTQAQRMVPWILSTFITFWKRQHLPKKLMLKTILKYHTSTFRRR